MLVSGEELVRRKRGTHGDGVKIGSHIKESVNTCSPSLSNSRQGLVLSVGSGSARSRSF